MGGFMGLEETRPIVNNKFFIRSAKDSGYKNAAYAIAELIDNSIQAGAKEVSLVCSDDIVEMGGNRYTRINEIAIYDNGEGMSPDILHKSLSFGDGSVT